MSVASFTLEPILPYRLDLTAWLLRRRAHNAMDRWTGSAYLRTLAVGNIMAQVSVSQQGKRLSVRVDTPGRTRVPQTILASTLDRILGGSVDLTRFYAFADGDPRLSTLCRRFRGAKPPQFPTVFEALVNAISCQQLSLTVGIALLNRLTLRFGSSTGSDSHAFPGASEMARGSVRDLRALGYSGSKAAAILGVARGIVDGRLDLESLRQREDRDAMETLLALPGVGPWTSGYVLLRGLGRLSVFPGGDVGALNNLADYLGLIRPRDEALLGRILEAWKPYGGLIYFHLLLNRLSIAGLVA
jgi:DNA-3-methyladenine glycosylase II